MLRHLLHDGGLMRCQACNVVKHYKKDWFKPQWERSSPVVMDHQGGDFDRCKDCYYGTSYSRPSAPAPAATAAAAPAPAPAATAAVAPADLGRQSDRTAIALCVKMLRIARAVGILENFVAHVATQPQLMSFRNFGAVTCVSESDLKQKRCRDGRWTFDPQNRCYEKAWWLAWPAATWNYNANTLGNVLESIIGIWEAAVSQRHYLAEDAAVKGVAQALSMFVHAVYSFVEYTDTMYTPHEAWLAYVGALEYTSTMYAPPEAWLAYVGALAKRAPGARAPVVVEAD